MESTSSDALWRSLVTNKNVVGNSYLIGDRTPPTSFGNMCEVFLFRVRKQGPKDFECELPSAQWMGKHVQPLVLNMQLGHQRFFVTRNGRIGLGSHKLQRDDEVVLFLGADMPFLVRSSGPHYRMIGAAYVDGLMRRKGLRFRTAEELKQNTRTFTLYWQAERRRCDLGSVIGYGCMDSENRCLGELKKGSRKQE
jgi:hypothetical protein